MKKFQTSDVPIFCFLFIDPEILDLILVSIEISDDWDSMICQKFYIKIIKYNKQKILNNQYD